MRFWISSALFAARRELGGLARSLRYDILGGERRSQRGMALLGLVTLVVIVGAGSYFTALSITGAAQGDPVAVSGGGDRPEETTVGPTPDGGPVGTSASPSP